jgi:hypothetical protein
VSDFMAKLVLQFVSMQVELNSILIWKKTSWTNKLFNFSGFLTWSLRLINTQIVQSTWIAKSIPCSHNIPNGDQISFCVRKLGFFGGTFRSEVATPNPNWCLKISPISFCVKKNLSFFGGDDLSNGVATPNPNWCLKQARFHCVNKLSLVFFGGWLK